MYSLVLMAALTSGQQSPELFFHHKGGHGGHGCAGCYGGCYGYGYAGWGQGNYGGHGCYGCGGCYGCAGGCWGWGYGGYAGCGGYNNLAYMPVPTVMHGVSEAPAGPAKPAKKKMMGAEEDDEVSAGNRARIIVDLPAGAKLYVDDRAVRNVSSRKRFHTPALQPGASYYYEVRAEVTVDGERHHETRRIVVRAGQVARTDFRTLGTAAHKNAKPARAVRASR